MKHILTRIVVSSVAAASAVAQPSRVVVDNLFPAGPVHGNELLTAIMDAREISADGSRMLLAAGRAGITGLPGGGKASATFMALTPSGEWICLDSREPRNWSQPKIPHEFLSLDGRTLSFNQTDPSLLNFRLTEFVGTQQRPFGTSSSWSGWFNVPSQYDVATLSWTRKSGSVVVLEDWWAGGVRIFDAFGNSRVHSDTRYARTEIDISSIAPLGDPESTPFILIGGAKGSYLAPSLYLVALDVESGSITDVPIVNASFTKCWNLSFFNGALYGVFTATDTFDRTFVYRLTGDPVVGLTATPVGDGLAPLSQEGVRFFDDSGLRDHSFRVFNYDDGRGPILAVMGNLHRGSLAHTFGEAATVGVLGDDDRWHPLFRTPSRPDLNSAGTTAVVSFETRFGKETYCFGSQISLLSPEGFPAGGDTPGVRIDRDGRVARLGRGTTRPASLLLGDPAGKALFAVGNLGTSGGQVYDLVASDGVTWSSVVGATAAAAAVFRRAEGTDELWTGGTQLQRLRDGVWTTITHPFIAITAIATVDEGEPDGETVYVIGSMPDSTAGGLFRWTGAGTSFVPLLAPASSIVGAKFADGDALVLRGEIPTIGAGIHRRAADGWITLNTTTNKAPLFVYHLEGGDQVVAPISNIPYRSSGGAFTRVSDGLTSANFANAQAVTFNDGTGASLYVVLPAYTATNTGAVVTDAPAKTSLIRLNGDTWQAVIPRRPGASLTTVPLKAITAIQSGPLSGVYVSCDTSFQSSHSSYNGIPAENLLCIKGMYCTADFNNSGGTPDDTDLAEFFNAWIQGSPDADTDLSGGAPDAQDIDTFLKAWLAGC